MSEFIYKPPETSLKPCVATIGVKFSENIYIHQKTAEKFNIPFEESDLEDMPWGKFLVIKRDES